VTGIEAVQELRRISLARLHHVCALRVANLFLNLPVNAQTPQYLGLPKTKRLPEVTYLEYLRSVTIPQIRGLAVTCSFGIWIRGSRCTPLGFGGETITRVETFDAEWVLRSTFWCLKKFGIALSGIYCAVDHCLAVMTFNDFHGLRLNVVHLGQRSVIFLDAVNVFYVPVLGDMLSTGIEHVRDELSGAQFDELL
jgi:hypothetical protein